METVEVGTEEGQEPPANEAPVRPPNEPTKVLPTDRISLKNILQLLRAYAIASDMGKKMAERQVAADLVKMNISTVTLAHPFLTDVGFLQKNGKKFIVAPEVVSYARAHEWNPDNAPHKLSPLVQKAWFAQALLTRLSFNPLQKDDAIRILAEASGSTPQYRNRLETLIEFMQTTGLIKVDGDQVSKVRTESKYEEDGDMPQPQQKDETSRSRTVVPSQLSASPVDGVVQFHISVKVDMNELKDWKADRIAAFFSGIAQVLAAKSGVENEE